MLRILRFLFIIVIAVIIIGLALIGSVLGAVLGLGKRSSVSGSRSQNSTHSNSGRGYYRPTQANDEEEIITETRVSKHKELFNDNEEEYVDYEEIKD